MADEDTHSSESAPATQAWLTYAVEHSGEEYLRARDVFLSRPTSLPMLNAEAGNRDWRRRLTAQAIAARIHPPPLVAYAEELLIGGGLPPPRNITGNHLPATLGEEIARLGAAIDPWLFESYEKLHRWQDEKENAVLFVAICERRSPELLLMLRSAVMEESNPVHFRALAVKAAVRTGNVDTWEEMHDLAKRSDAPAQLRRSAIFALSELPKDALVDFRRTCESILLDQSEPVELRAEAVSALASLGSEASQAALYQAAQQENDEEVLQELCTTLVDIIGPGSTRVMRNIGKKLTSSVGRRLWQESLDDLERRVARKEHPE